MLELLRGDAPAMVTITETRLTEVVRRLVSAAITRSDCCDTADPRVTQHFRHHPWRWVTRGISAAVSISNAGAALTKPTNSNAGHLDVVNIPSSSNPAILPLTTTGERAWNSSWEPLGWLARRGKPSAFSGAAVRQPCLEQRCAGHQVCVLRTRGGRRRRSWKALRRPHSNLEMGAHSRCAWRGGFAVFQCCCVEAKPPRCPFWMCDAPKSVATI